MSLLSVENVTAGYGDVQVLWGVDLRVQQGEIVSLIGSNGVGKSTLLRTISGLIPTRSGRITLGDADIGTLYDKIFRDVNAFNATEDFKDDIASVVTRFQ